MLFSNLLKGFPSEDAMACEHAIQNSTQRVHVGISIDGPALDLLWGRSAGRAHTIERVGLWVLPGQLEHAQDPKLGNGQVSI